MNNIAEKDQLLMIISRSKQTILRLQNENQALQAKCYNTNAQLLFYKTRCQQCEINIEYLKSQLRQYKHK